MFQRVLKGLLVFLLGLIAANYTTFVLILLWDSFAAPALHLPRISYY
jgi:hypothetical protein